MVLKFIHSVSQDHTLTHITLIINSFIKMHKESLPKILIVFNIQNMSQPVTEVLLFLFEDFGAKLTNVIKDGGRGGQAPG